MCRFLLLVFFFVSSPCLASDCSDLLNARPESYSYSVEEWIEEFLGGLLTSPLKEANPTPFQISELPGSEFVLAFRLSKCFFQVFIGSLKEPSHGEDSADWSLFQGVNRSIERQLLESDIRRWISAHCGSTLKCETLIQSFKKNLMRESILIPAEDGSTYELSGLSSLVGLQDSELNSTIKSFVDSLLSQRLLSIEKYLED